MHRPGSITPGEPLLIKQLTPALWVSLQLLSHCVRLTQLLRILRGGGQIDQENIFARRVNS